MAFEDNLSTRSHFSSTQIAEDEGDKDKFAGIEPAMCAHPASI